MSRSSVSEIHQPPVTTQITNTLPVAGSDADSTAEPIPRQQHAITRDDNGSTYSSTSASAGNVDDLAKADNIDVCVTADVMLSPDK